MAIRIAQPDDAASIRNLLEQLDYPMDLALLQQQMARLLAHPDHHLVVYEAEEGVTAFLSMHFIPQIGLAGDLAIISYFAVDANARSKGIGQAMEAYAELTAQERKCSRIQLHCSMRRTDAHRFYERQGYRESRKYFTKTPGEN